MNSVGTEEKDKLDELDYEILEILKKLVFSEIDLPIQISNYEEAKEIINKYNMKIVDTENVEILFKMKISQKEMFYRLEKYSRLGLLRKVEILNETYYLIQGINIDSGATT